jgi:protein phosphatase 1G
MGVYLSTPNTEKISIDKSSKKFSYGASSMQGWRVSQEVTILSSCSVDKRR